MSSLLHPVSTEVTTNEVEEVEDQFGDDGEETAAEDEDEEEEEEDDQSDSGLDETSSCNEDEEKYADQPGGGLSPRKVLKRAMATLQEDEDCGGGGARRLQRVDTFSDFERTVDTGDDAPPVCGHASSFGPSFCGPPLHRVDTFGQSMTASAEAAARARTGAGRPLACPALARVGQNSSSTGVHGGLPMHRIPSAAGLLRALPEVEDAMRAVDGLNDLLNAPEPGEHYPATEARSLPVVRQDTLDLLQHPSHGQVARTASAAEP